MLDVATFHNKRDNLPRRFHVAWPHFAKRMLSHQERRDKDGPLWSPTVYRDHAGRGNGSVDALTAAVGDFDKGVPYELVKERLAAWEYVAHSTYSHKAKAPKFRVILPFAQPIPTSLWADVKARIDEHVFGLAADPSTKDASRIYYLPSCPPGGVRFAEHHGGELLDPLLLPPASHNTEAGDNGSPSTVEGEAKMALGKTALDFVANGAPVGEQRSRALSAARNYLSAGYSVQDTVEAIWRGLQASRQDPERESWSHQDAKELVEDLASKDAPPLETEQPLPPRCEMRQVGLGYRFQFPAQGVTVTVDRMRRNSDGLAAELRVDASIPLAPRTLFWGKTNLASPPSRKTVKSSIKDLLAEYGAGDGGVNWQSIIDDVCWRVASTERAGEPFQLVGNLPQTERITWLIKNLAPRNEAMTIFGEGGSGKSYLALSLALSVLTGKTLVPGFPPLESGPVLYLDWEAGPARLDQRVKRLCAGAGMAPVDVPYRRCMGSLADQIEEVLRYCQSEGMVLVVVDSVEMAMTGETSEDRDPNAAVKRLHAALRLLKRSTILVDHVNKESIRERGKKPTPYGGVYKINLARMVYELRSKPEPGTGKLLLALNNTKRNDDGPVLPSVGLNLEFTPEGARYRSQGITDEDLLGGLRSWEKIALTLQDGPMNAKAIAECLGVDEANVRATLSQNKGRFVRLVDGHWANLETNRTEDEIDF